MIRDMSSSASNHLQTTHRPTELHQVQSDFEYSPSSLKKNYKVRQAKTAEYSISTAGKSGIDR